MGPLEVDIPGRRARVNGVDVDLTKREFDLLAVLAEHKTAVLSRAQLLELVWGYDFAADTNVVDVFIGYLRRKLDVAYDPQAQAPHFNTWLTELFAGHDAKALIDLLQGRPPDLRAHLKPAPVVPDTVDALEYVPPVKVTDYEDAVPGFEGKWLAAFAPVGNTGFAVLVQTRRHTTLNLR